MKYAEYIDYTNLKANATKEDIKNSKGDIYAILNFDYINDFNRVMEEIKWK